MKALTAGLALCLVLTAPSRGGLMDHTGETYNWVSYNNLLVGGFTAYNPNAGVTDFTPKNQDPTGVILSGAATEIGTSALLRDYVTGNPTATYANSVYTGGWFNGYYREGRGDPVTAGTPAGIAFGDVLGSHYALAGSFQGDNGAGHWVSFTFSNLNPNKTYTFAGIATTDNWPQVSDGRGSAAMSKVVITDALSFVNNSTKTARMTDGSGNWLVTYDNGVATANVPTVEAEFAAMTAASDYAYISGRVDDMVLFNDIVPSALGTFTITVSSKLYGQFGDDSDYHSSGNEVVSFDAFALGEVAIPEPATMSLLVLGGIAVLRRRARGLA